MAISFIESNRLNEWRYLRQINYSGIPAIWAGEITGIPAGKELYRVGVKVYLWDYDGVNEPITYSVLADMRKPPNRDNTAAFDISPVADSVMGVRSYDTFGRFNGIPNILLDGTAEYDMPAALISLDLYVITKDTTTGSLDTELIVDGSFEYRYLFVKGAPAPHYNAAISWWGGYEQLKVRPTKWLTCAPNRVPKVTEGSPFNFVILTDNTEYDYINFDYEPAGPARALSFPNKGNLRGLLRITWMADTGFEAIDGANTIISFGDDPASGEILRFQVVPRCPDKTIVTITWLNQWGGLDFYEFTAAYSETLEADIQTFTPTPDMPDNMTATGLTTVNGPVGTAGTTRRRITLNSDITTEDEGYLFEDLMRSPFIVYEFNREDLSANTFSGIQAYPSRAEPVSRSLSRARRYDQFGKFYYTFDFIIHAGAPTIGL